MWVSCRCPVGAVLRAFFSFLFPCFWLVSCTLFVCVRVVSRLSVGSLFLEVCCGFSVVSCCVSCGCSCCLACLSGLRSLVSSSPSRACSLVVSFWFSLSLCVRLVCSCVARPFSLGALWGCAVVGFAGSRALPLSASGLVSSVVSAVVGSGSPVAVGCCVGADALVLRSALAVGASVSLFAVGSSSGAGFWSGSCAGLLSLASRCASVVWLAGGPLSVPLFARLARRSSALLASVASAGGSLVVFVSSPPSARSGSWRLVWSALFSRVPVVVFPVSGCPLPSACGLFPVRWSPSPVFSGGFVPSVS